jgi:hypothetical protein
MLHVDKLAERCEDECCTPPPLNLSSKPTVDRSEDPSKLLVSAGTIQKSACAWSNHCRDHALEAQEDSELNGDEHDREDDPNNRGDQSNPVMKQIAGCKRENEGHRAMCNE